eukprot:583003-Lingulodinium_polyedra.AAC.1
MPACQHLLGRAFLEAAEAMGAAGCTISCLALKELACADLSMDTGVAGGGGGACGITCKAD